MTEMTRELVNADGVRFHLVHQRDCTYLLTRPFLDRDRCTDCDVAVLELTVVALTAWLEDIALAERLAAAHGLEGITFREPAGPDFYGASSHEADDWAETEAFDDGTVVMPDWAAVARVDALMRDVRPCGVSWRALHHYADTPLEITTEWLDAEALTALRRHLLGPAAAPVARPGRAAPAPPTDAAALDAIATLLTEQEWHADTITAVADLVRASGRLVRDLP